MAVTGQQVLTIALTLIDEVTTAGVVDRSDLTLPTKALSFITILQAEMKSNSAASDVVLKKLDDPLALSDWQALSILPYGLAALLCLQQDSSSADFFQQKFEEGKKKNRATIGPIKQAQQGTSVKPAAPLGSDFDGGSFTETPDIDGGSFSDTSSGDLDGGTF